MDAGIRHTLAAVPEGHVIHRLSSAITARFGHREVQVASPQGRFAAASALLNGTELVSADAVGKHLLIDFEGGRTVWIHLGLIGKLWFVPVDGVVPHPATLRMRIADPTQAADLRGPQWCRLIDPAERDAVVASAGPDPLRPGADPERAWKKVHASGRPIGVLLMDQKVFAGVGNIFRAEVLFRHGIDPLLPAKKLPRDIFDSVWADLVVLMAYAVKAGKIDTVAPAHMPEAMGRPPRVDAHGGEVYVYRRLGEPCWVCGTPVAGAALAGRNLYWCPSCQPAGSVGHEVEL